jgi:hypothetical protein
MRLDWTCRWRNLTEKMNRPDPFWSAMRPQSWQKKILALIAHMHRWADHRWRLMDPVRITKSSRHDPHGRRKLTRVNSTNVLDKGLMIGGRATTRDSRIEIGTRHTQVHVPAVEDRYILLAI